MQHTLASRERKTVMFDQQGIDGFIGQSFNGYRITEYIARGGMGVVYKGIQDSLNRPVAIKILYPHLSADESFRERFAREARAAAQLSHPGIVRVIDFGRFNESHYMVLDYIDGESLRDYLSRLHGEGLVLRTDRLIRILQEVAAALGYAHEQGFVHRDVKPGNILLTKDGRALLTDFGVVKSIHMSQLTNAGAVIGTPEYVAPEQSMDAAAIGPAADQYSLGIVAYEMLTGRVPFQGQTPTAMLRMHMSEPPPPPTRFAGWIPPAAEAVVLQALAKQPEDRHPGVVAFVNRLAEALRQEQPVAATPPPWPGPEQTAAATIGAFPAAQTITPTGGEPTPPPPPETPAGVTSGDGPPPNRRLLATGLAGLLLLTLLACGVGGYFVFLRDDDEDTAANATPTTAMGAESPSATEAIAAETAFVPDPTETATEEPAPTATGETATEPEATETAVESATATEIESSPSPSPSPTQESCTDFILFASHRGEVHDSQIYIMNPDGTEQRQLTYARGHSWGPRVSPDGSMFVFSSVAPGEHTDHSATGGGTQGSGNHQIYLAAIDGSSILNLTAGSTAWNNAWTWSPDGSLITFASDRHGNWELYTMEPDGGNVVRLTNTPENEGWPSWTPDGRYIIYASDVSGTSEIYIMNSDGTNRRQLTNMPDRFNTYPYVSPDGTKIVFSSQVTAVNEGEIYVMDLDGGNLTRLTSTAALNYAPSWSPDGSKIVFVSDRDGNDNIWVMDADGSNPTRLTTERGEDTTPHWGYTCTE